MTLTAWQTRYALRVDLHTLGRPAHVDQPDVSENVFSRVLDLPFERHDAYNVIAARPALLPVLRDAVEHIERGKWSEAEALATLLEKGGDSMAAMKLRGCHNPDQGWWKFYPDNSKQPKYYADRCWLRVCPHCATAFANKLRARYEERIRKVMAQGVQSWSLKKLELTMRRSNDIARDLVDLHKMTKKLFKHFFADDKRAGAFGCAELGPRGGNVHVHLVVYGRWVSQKEISTYWEKLSRKHRAMYSEATQGEGDRVVYVKRVEPGAAVREAIKYVTKLAKKNPTDENESPTGFILSVEDLAALHFALKGKRRVWSWGAFYGVDDTDEESEGLQELADDLAEESASVAAVVPVVVAHTRLKFILRQLHSTVENNCTVLTHPPGALSLGPAPGWPS